MRQRGDRPEPGIEREPLILIDGEDALSVLTGMCSQCGQGGQGVFPDPRLSAAYGHGLHFEAGTGSTQRGLDLLQGRFRPAFGQLVCQIVTRGGLCRSHPLQSCFGFALFFVL